MLKKSDIQALLKHFPEEFEAFEFFAAVRQIEDQIFTKEEWAKIGRGVQEVQAGGGIPFEEAIERIEKCQAAKS